ncbi:MAG: type VI secretion system tube protein Hcp [Deltaproteobacteria bacterium]|mgnify:CR=1 FL=1|nr:MAG: type VI secretion system tube protein Hcp [Deltaproteobacteria bacterium]RLB03603.1 MAG: type VI secretion system tube protein Hcp [Deltaproteobacteria bacterium]
MPMPAHLELEGKNQGKIEGSCEIQGREGTILVQAVEHDIHIPRSPQTGLPTGKRVHNPLTITKIFDKASPKLYQALCSGEQFSNVTIKWYRIDPTGQEEHYFTTKLEDAIIVSIKAWMPNALDPKMESYQHMEDVSFTYKKIIWTWEPDGIESEDSWKEPKA